MEAPKHDGPGGGAVLASAAVHGVLLLAAWWAHNSFEPPVHYEVIQIELVSLPPAAAQVEEPEPDPLPAPEELIVETPDPDPPAPEPDPIPVPEERAPEREEPPPPVRQAPREPTPPPPTPPEETRPRTTTEPTPETTMSGDDINVRMEGLRRDYPVYYENIIVQIRRCFRWQGGGGWSTRVQFEIGRDGSVSRLQVVQPSGSATFDIEAEGAIECAGRGGRFGPLPEDLPFDRLPIQFVFTPDR